MQAVTGVWVIVGLMVLVLMFLMAMFASMFRKAGPHEALIVYGFRGARRIGERRRHHHFSDGRKLQGAIARADVL